MNVSFAPSFCWTDYDIPTTPPPLTLHWTVPLHNHSCQVIFSSLRILLTIINEQSKPEMQICIDVSMTNTLSWIFYRIWHLKVSFFRCHAYKFSIYYSLLHGNEITTSEIHWKQHVYSTQYEKYSYIVWGSTEILYLWYCASR